MKAIDKAYELINAYKMILMSEDTDCGYEILCSTIAVKNALVAVDEILRANPHSNPFNTIPESTYSFWQDVKDELNNI